MCLQQSQESVHKLSGSFLFFVIFLPFFFFLFGRRFRDKGHWDKAGKLSGKVAGGAHALVPEKDFAFHWRKMSDWPIPDHVR